MSVPHRSVEPKKAPASVYLATVVVVFFLTLSAADSIGFVPYYIDGTEPKAVADTSSDTQIGSSVALSNLPELGDENAEAIAPERIQIPAIDLDLAIQNPSTKNIDALDELLKNGPARYVDSAKLGEKGNMIIFAHSSHLPVVRNQMYKAFNRIPELKQGDTVTLIAGGKRYMYAVNSVEKADATDTRIDMSKDKGTRLTLVTCDTLTSKSSRFVLDASFIGSYSL